MKMQRTAPRRRVKGFAFLRRTDPMGRAMEAVGVAAVFRQRSSAARAYTSVQVEGCGGIDVAVSKRGLNRVARSQTVSPRAEGSVSGNERSDKRMPAKTRNEIGKSPSLRLSQEREMARARADEENTRRVDKLWETPPVSRVVGIQRIRDIR